MILIIISSVLIFFYEFQYFYCTRTILSSCVQNEFSVGYHAILPFDEKKKIKHTFAKEEQYLRELFVVQMKYITSIHGISMFFSAFRIS